MAAEKPSESENPFKAVVSKLAVALMQERLNQGKGIEIPSLGIMITPDGNVRRITDISDLDLANLRKP